jgi:putative FmdB family regulatory protein
VRYNKQPEIEVCKKELERMPVYTYRCSNCGVQFEKQQSFSDQSLLRCPECGKRALKKIYLPVGIVFKGSGFYATDHHSPSGQLSKKTDEMAEEKKKTGESKNEPEVKAEKSSKEIPEKNSEKKE